MPLGKLPYDPWTAHGIPLADLLACAEAEGVTFRVGDILLIRGGFMVRYYGATEEERTELASKPETLCVFSRFRTCEYADLEMFWYWVHQRRHRTGRRHEALPMGHAFRRHSVRHALRRTMATTRA